MIWSNNNPRKLKSLKYGGRFLYPKKTYINPFFRKNRRQLIKPDTFITTRFKLLMISLIVLFFIIIWLVFFSTLFKITNFKISGVGEASAKEIEIIAREMAANRIVGKYNLLLYNKKELGRLLNDKYFTDNLVIKRKFPRTLEINIQEKTRTAIWREDDKYFYLDKEGNVINQIDSLNINRLAYPLIENLSDIKINERQTCADSRKVAYVLELFNEYKDNKHGFDIDRFIVDNEIETIKMSIIGGPKIYFTTKETVAVQSASLDIIISEKLKDSFKTKEYINLKYGNNIYVK